MRVESPTIAAPAGAIILAQSERADRRSRCRAPRSRRCWPSIPTSPVVIDEAYVDFGAETAIPLIASHPNLLVVQTMSKSRALAGLRVGYALGDAGLIEALTPGEGQLQLLSARPACAGRRHRLACRTRRIFRQTRAQRDRGREQLTADCIRLGFEVLPSAANFVFARHPAQQGARLAAALRERAVIVRHFAAPRIADYLRITVGTDAQIERLLSALSDILGSEPAAA